MYIVRTEDTTFNLTLEVMKLRHRILNNLPKITQWANILIWVVRPLRAIHQGSIFLAPHGPGTSTCLNGFSLHPLGVTQATCIFLQGSQIATARDLVLELAVCSALILQILVLFKVYSVFLFLIFRFLDTLLSSIFIVFWIQISLSVLAQLWHKSSPIVSDTNRGRTIELRRLSMSSTHRRVRWHLGGWELLFFLGYSTGKSPLHQGSSIPTTAPLGAARISATPEQAYPHERI